MARYFSSTQSVKRMKLGISATRRSRGIMSARLRRAVAQGVSLAGGRLCTMSTAKEELTRLIHGDSGLTAAKKATEVFFGAAIENLTDAQLADIFADVPSQTLPRDTGQWRRGYVNWGPGIVGHCFHEGGIPMAVFYGLVFGIGWGLAGFCPGPAIVVLGAGYAKAAVFVVAMLLGMGAFELIDRHGTRTDSAMPDANRP